MPCILGMSVVQLGPLMSDTVLQPQEIYLANTQCAWSTIVIYVLRQKCDRGNYHHFSDVESS
jgi:hypothetical protein